MAGCDLTEEHPSRLACTRAESTFLATFGVSPIQGSNFSTEEDGPNAPQVCLISYALWKNRFGGSAAALGKTLSLDGQTTRIIGVLPQNFEWPTLARVDIILPEAISPAERTNPIAGVVRAYARLKPGLTMAEARAQLAPTLETWREASPPMFRKEIRLGLVSVREDQVGSIRLALLVLFGASLAFLVLAAANVASLFLARGAAREHELAVRAALGASRSRLIVLQLTESTSIVVSKKLADRLFPRQNAVGQHLQLSVPSGPWYTVVGVAGDVTYLSESGRVGHVDPEYYVARKNLSAGAATPEDVDRHAFFLVRSPMKSAAVERLVRGEIASLDPTLPTEISTLSARINLLRVEPRFNAALISLFATMGFLLAMIGLYGVLALLVSSRTSEIGVRMALGAKPENVLTMVVRHGVRLMLAGLAAGAAMALSVAHFLQGLLYGVSPLNPAIASMAALLLLLAGLAACYVPARRASRVDPMVALRYE